MVQYEKIDLALLDPVYAYFEAEGWDEYEALLISSADSLGFDMIHIDSLIKAMGREHEVSTVFHILNIASDLLEQVR